jgi:hypothetical protein
LWKNVFFSHGSTTAKNTWHGTMIHDMPDGRSVSGDEGFYEYKLGN